MAKKQYLEGRIRYEENYRNEGEYFLFETKWSDEEEWGLDTAFKLWPDDVYGGKGEFNMLHYTALTKIREWQKLNIKFYFA